MRETVLDQIREVIQEDVGGRGLRSDPHENLITATLPDFTAACRSLAEASSPVVAVVTGFFIPHATPPCGETDGPLGALFLARALAPLGVKVILATDRFCFPALEAGLQAADLQGMVGLIALPEVEAARTLGPERYAEWFARQAGPLTHLVALERVGPGHTAASASAPPNTTDDLAEFERRVPVEERDRCRTMRGRDITDLMSPAHWLFERTADMNPGITTIGIGDGGNELGMGRIPWRIIANNIPRGDLVACRVPTDQLVVCGISNWGAYGLAAGVRTLCKAAPDAALFDPEVEYRLLDEMVRKGPLVDGVSGEQAARVDGLSFERYAEPLRRLQALGGA